MQLLNGPFVRLYELNENGIVTITNNSYEIALNQYIVKVLEFTSLDFEIF